MTSPWHYAAMGFAAPALVWLLLWASTRLGRRR
jgi:hypothetical protein